jgi:hypothetical protein
MSSVPERPPIIRGEQVFLRASERTDIELRDEWSMLRHRRSWEYD